MNDRSTLVARAGGEVTQRADKVGELSWSRTLGGHLTVEVAVLLLYSFLDSFLELVARQSGKVVVCKILELKLVGSAVKAVGICG